MATFLEEFQAGLVDAESIHDWIEDWHASTSAQDIPLTEYLGMTEQQYSDWLRDPATLYLMDDGSSPGDSAP
jgi:hypothetical protein